MLHQFAFLMWRGFFPSFSCARYLKSRSYFITWFTIARERYAVDIFISNAHVPPVMCHTKLQFPCKIAIYRSKRIKILLREFLSAKEKTFNRRWTLSYSFLFLFWRILCFSYLLELKCWSVRNKIKHSSCS